MSKLEAVQLQNGAQFASLGAQQVPVDYGSYEQEYTHAKSQYGLHDRSYRGLIEVCGQDHLTWTHNLVTNEVRNLNSGDGNYAFALDVKGRILFDLNIIAHQESLWLDLDRRLIDAALKHFSKYVLMDDVKLSDVSDQYGRLAVLGPECPAVFSGCNLKAMAQLQHQNIEIDGHQATAIRHDFAGCVAGELIVPADSVVPLWKYLSERDAQLVGLTAVDTLRIEAGIPWSVSDLNEQVLPAETRQVARAVSFNKGCYLGQEVVERMRARDAMAKSLIGVSCDQALESGCTLVLDDQQVGVVTSTCCSPTHGHIGLAYVKASVTKASDRLSAAGRLCSMQSLPF